MKKILLFIVLFTSIATMATAQFQNYNWIFGTNAAITFDKVTKKPTASLLGNRPNYNLEGCAIANDPLTGKVLFYTDGTTLFNSTNAVMDGGDAIGGINNNTPAQAAAIAAFPDCQGKKFYIFVTTANHNSTSPAYGVLSMTIVDMTLNNGLGKVIVKNKYIKGDADEGMIIINNIAANKTWLVSHTPRSQKWFSCEVTADPNYVGDSTNFKNFIVESPDKKVLNSTYSIKYGKANGKIAFGNWTPQRRVNTVDFDWNTGVISNFNYIDTNAFNALNDNTTSQIVGVEWSPDGTKLYASTLNSLVVYQYDLSDNNKRTVLNTDLTGGQAGAMKLGPDGIIYHRANLSNATVNAIKNPNVAGAACMYTKDVLGGFTDVTYYNFPEEADYIRYEPKVEASKLGLCSSEDIDLIVNEGTAWLWNTGETTRNITVNATGIYTCMVSYPNSCVVPAVITIIQNPTPVADAGSDISVPCGQSTTLNGAVSGGKAPFIYQWLGNAASGKTYSNVTAGTYVLMVTDSNGCVSLDTIKVGNTGSTLDATIIMNRIACKGAPTQLTANVTGANGTVSYLWSNGEITESINPTLNSDSVFTLKVTDGAACTINTSLAVKLSPDAAASFEFSIINQTVNFLGATGNGITSWAWDFGDMTTSTEQNPQHTYTKLGTYAVTLVVTNSCGSSTKKFSITVDGNNGGGTTDINNNPALAIAAYPNPFSQYFTLANTEGKNLQVNVYDVIGKMMYSQNIKNAAENINISTEEWPKGFYFVNINSNGQNATLKVVKR